MADYDTKLASDLLGVLDDHEQRAGVTIAELDRRVLRRALKLDSQETK
jgi:hypothetical protein